jgi:outer membrane protein TolC
MGYLGRSSKLALAVLLSAAGPSLAEESLDLDGYLEQVRTANPALVAARERAAGSAHRVLPARAWDDPFLAIGPDGIAEGGGGPELLRYQVSQSIPFPGKRSARGVAAEERSQSAAADVETVERQVIVAATQTFYRALYTERALELNRELTLLVDEAAASGKARYRTGEGAHHEWLLAKAELGVFATERVRLESDVVGLRAELNELRDRPADASFGALVAELAVGGDDGVFASIPESPEIRSLASVARATEAERRGAALAPLPDLVVQGMLEDPRDPMEDRMWGVMFGISIPLFWPWKQRELLFAAERERDAALAEKKTIENRLGAELARARAELTAARRTVALYEADVLPATEMALAAARSGYVVGRVSLSDLVGVARARRTQALEHLAARIDFALAHTRIEELLSAPPVLRLAPAAPTLFGTGMAAGGMRGGMAPQTAIRVGRGMGLGAARGTGGAAAAGTTERSMGGM